VPAKGTSKEDARGDRPKETGVKKNLAAQGHEAVVFYRRKSAFSIYDREELNSKESIVMNVAEEIKNQNVWRLLESN
jgi:hypothetical protein